MIHKRFFRSATITSLGACVALAASPVSAMELPIAPRIASPAVASPWVPDNLTARQVAYRGYPRRGGYRGYRGYRDYHRGPDAGTVIAGIAVIGAVAAIAASALKDRRNQTRYDDYRYPDQPTNYRTQTGYGDTTGLDRAASICTSEIERTVRVQGVDTVDRTAAGWTVAGQLYDGRGFTCRLDESGRIAGIRYGGLAANQTYGQDNQYDDATYARVRAEQDGYRPYAASAVGKAVPAYPGGPLPGDE